MYKSYTAGLPIYKRNMKRCARDHRYFHQNKKKERKQTTQTKTRKNRLYTV